MLPRIAYISEESEDLDRRYARRRTLFLPTEPPDVPWGRRAILLDLSETGLRMQCHAPPEVGEEFAVELPMAGPVTARIIWQNDLECGAEFTEAISRAAVSAAVLSSPPRDHAAPSTAQASGSPQVELVPMRSEWVLVALLPMVLLLLFALAFLPVSSW